jgi:cold shock CspA family protein
MVSFKIAYQSMKMNYVQEDQNVHFTIVIKKKECQNKNIRF